MTEHAEYCSRNILLTCAIALVIAVGGGSVRAHPAGPMALVGLELDGNAVTDNPNQGIPDDWDRPYTGDGHQDVWTGILADPAGLTTWPLGVLDTDEISYWTWHDGTVPAKDELTNAYAAAYYGYETYFGADRYGNNDNAYFGFWLLQDDVGLNPEGTFYGDHAVGDVLILVTAFQMGGVAEMRVFQWVGSGGSEGSLDEITFGIDEAYGIVNGSDATAPWPYTPAFGTPGVFPVGCFFEGGIDLDALGISCCFETFLAETRTSPTVTASRKDFVLGGLTSCAGVGGSGDFRRGYDVGRICPNPFSRATSVSFHLPEPAPVTVGVYDIHGRLVRTLIDHDCTAGSRSVSWNGDADTGGPAQAGVYFVCIRAGGFTASRKLVKLQ